MATIHATGPVFTITGQNLYILGDASDAFVGTYQVHLVSDTFVGSVSVVARSRQPQAATDSVAFVAWNYLNTYVNGAVGDQTYVSTAITDTSCILIPATGVQIALNCSAFTSGTLKAYVTPMVGSAA